MDQSTRVRRPPTERDRPLRDAVEARELGAPRRLPEAASVTLIGEFVAGHREEIVALVRGVEARARSEDPAERITALRDEPHALVVDTADVRLARSIGDAVQARYGGSLEYRYSDEEGRLRVNWRR